MSAAFFPFLPIWAEYLIAGIMVMVLLISAGIAIGKTGRHPAWALLLLVPWAQIIVFWLVAYCVWPFRRQNQTH
jgi:heme/copper-type cytochrome/quinol oxidase subunit 2